MISMNLMQFLEIHHFMMMMVINKMMENFKNGNALMSSDLHSQHENQKAYLHHRNLHDMRENFTT